VISLEDPETVANFALDIKTQNLPADFYKNYLKNINAVSKEEVMAAAKKYFLNDRARIVVTGKGSAILEGLEQLSFNNQPIKLNYYNKWGEEIDRPDYSKSMPEGTTAAFVIDNYLKAIGGSEKLKEIETLKESSQAAMSGMTIEIVNYKTTEKQSLTEMKMMGNIVQKQVANKTYAYMEMQGQKIDLEGKELEQFINETVIFPELDLNFEKVQLIGISEVDGQKAYEIKISENQTNFYDTETFLKVQIIQTIEIMGNAQTSTTKFGDYKDVSGILFPYKKSITSGPQELDFTTSEIDLNSELDPKIFN